MNVLNSRKCYSTHIILGAFGRSELDAWSNLRHSASWLHAYPLWHVRDRDFEPDWYTPSGRHMYTSWLICPEFTRHRSSIQLAVIHRVRVATASYCFTSIRAQGIFVCK